jgi:hypothetical protein
MPIVAFGIDPCPQRSKKKNFESVFVVFVSFVVIGKFDHKGHKDHKEDFLVTLFVVSDSYQGFFRRATTFLARGSRIFGSFSSSRTMIQSGSPRSRSVRPRL